MRLRLLWMVVALAACPKSPGPLPPVTLTIDPGSRSLAAGGVKVTFTATLVGSDAPIGWSLEGPGGLSAAAGNSTDYTPPASVTGATSARLTATAASEGVSASADVTLVPPATITVTGTVVARKGSPLENTPVVIGGASASTDADGKFTISGVNVPYDVTVVVEPNARKLAVVYVGLTRPDPTLTARDLDRGASHTATLSGAMPPAGATDQTAVTFGSGNVPFAAGAASPGTGTYSIDPTWFGSTNPAGSLHALRWTPDGTGVPTDFRFGQLAVASLSDGAVLAGQDLALAAAASLTTSGTVTLPAGYSFANKFFSARFAEGDFVDLVTDFTASGDFSFPAPDLSSVSPGSGAQVRVFATSDTGAGDVQARFPGLAAGATGIALTAPAAPVLQLPPQAATGIDTAVNFSWTPFPGGVHMLDVVPQAGAGSAPEYRIVGAATTAKIPDLSSVGLGLPGATQYSWFLLGFGPFGSIDEAAGPKGLEAPDIVAQSSSRAFTTR